MKTQAFRPIIILIFSMLFVPHGVYAARTQSVTVVNDSTAPVPVTVQNLPSGKQMFEFVGFSSETFTGGQGVITYTTACQKDFPGSRMCTSVEFLNTVNYPSSLPSVNGWIRPVFQPTGNSQDLDASGGGAGALGAKSCRGWSTDDGPGGLSVDSHGRFLAQPCRFAISVACCAPQ